MKMIGLLKFISLSIVAIFSSNSFACTVKTPSYINLAISTVEEKVFSYGIKNIDENLPVSVVSGCRDSAIKKRFVMISFGPNIVDVTDDVRGNNFDRKYGGLACFIKNNPFGFNNSEELRKSVFEKKWKFINECAEITVTEGGARPLSFPVEQSGCKVTALSSKSAVFSGGFCFFKPSQDSEYLVSVSVKDSCKSLEGLKKYNMNILDLEAELAFFTSNDYKDEVNMSGIGTTPVRLSTNPIAQLFKPSDDFGLLRPTFPGNFPVNDIHLGKIVIEETGEDSVSIKTPFIVNNICKSVDKNGISSSICDYSNPYVGEVSLINSKGVTEASWYDGGVAAIQWQGILGGEGENLAKNLLRKNEAYKIEVVFSDPYFDFNTFKKRIKNKIQRIEQGMPDLISGGGIGEISEIKPIGAYEDMLEVDPISDINFETGISDLSGSRRRLNTFFTSSYFPPMYERACNPDSGVCEKIGKPFVKFTASFKVNDDYSISELVVERDSKILGSYKKNITEQPTYNCM